MIICIFVNNYKQSQNLDFFQKNNIDFQFFQSCNTVKINYFLYLNIPQSTVCKMSCGKTFSKIPTLYGTTISMVTGCGPKMSQYALKMLYSCQYGNNF